MVRRGSTVRVRQRASAKVPANCHFVVVCLLNTRTHSGHICGTRDAPRRLAASSDTSLGSAVEYDSGNSLQVASFRCGRQRDLDPFPAGRGSAVGSRGASDRPLPESGVSVAAGFPCFLKPFDWRSLRAAQCRPAHFWDGRHWNELRLRGGLQRLRRGRRLWFLEGAAVLEMGQPLEPLRQVPVPVAELLHRRRQEDRADDRRIDQDRRGETNAEPHPLPVAVTSTTEGREPNA